MYQNQQNGMNGGNQYQNGQGNNQLPEGRHFSSIELLGTINFKYEHYIEKKESNPTNGYGSSKIGLNLTF